MDDIEITDEISNCDIIPSEAKPEEETLGKGKLTRCTGRGTGIVPPPFTTVVGGTTPVPRPVIVKSSTIWKNKVD